MSDVRRPQDVGAVHRAGDLPARHSVDAAAARVAPKPAVAKRQRPRSDPGAVRCSERLALDGSARRLSAHPCSPAPPACAPTRPREEEALPAARAQSRQCVSPCLPPSSPTTTGACARGWPRSRLLTKSARTTNEREPAFRAAGSVPVAGQGRYGDGCSRDSRPSRSALAGWFRAGPTRPSPPANRFRTFECADRPNEYAPYVPFGLSGLRRSTT